MSRMLQIALVALMPSKPEPGLTVLDPVTTTMRVLPQDLDYMMVVNNGTYQQLTRGGELRTRGVVCTRFVHRRNRERIDPRDIVPLLAEQQGYTHAIPESPELPADVAAWARSWQNPAATNAPRAVAGAGTGTRVSGGVSAVERPAAPGRLHLRRGVLRGRTGTVPALSGRRAAHSGRRPQ